MSQKSSSTLTKPSLIKIWLLASRPKTLLASISPVCIGTSYAATHASFNILLALACLMGAMGIQIATNWLNDAYDFKKGADTKKRLGPLRVTQAKWLSVKTLLKASFCLCGILFLFTLGLSFLRGPYVIALGCVSIFLAYSYTTGPFPISYLGLGEVFAFLFFGPISTASTYFIITGHFSLASILMGLPCGFFSSNMLTINNLRDIETVKKVLKKTLSVKLGATFSKWQITCFMLMAIVFFPILETFQQGWSALFLLIFLPQGYTILKIIFKKKGVVLNSALEKTAILALFYSILFSIIILLNQPKIF